ncbi:organic hydroperoxide reductase OsmC/OhrA [Methylorubrum rhodinum]|uniref:Organic hydroperoxide reductase OsmC/OhrA n=1 Tax=Methylorubrum rhodinum TaxID=29428 RepID=A0A840ZK49_9HYPH|nr:OsmC family protein [Methylorubrum rhodinum]MBB5757926.1 organic hydroperoxide reductase OsmC/OhrA [Methylorubrum rhodinum]
MARHVAEVDWSLRAGEDFAAGRYGRGHTLRFDGGIVMPGSASPHVVGKWADPAAVDPEEMLVAALSACHMLSFLHVARLAGFGVSAYRDRAEGTMAEIAPGRQAVTRVVLHPAIDWTGAAPDADRLAALHAEAHAVCFIANSVRAEIIIA